MISSASLLTGALRGLVVAGALAVSACATGTLSGGPAAPFDLDADIRAIEAQLEDAASVATFYDKGASQSGRNALISARMSLIDLHYARYLRELNATRASTQVAYDVSDVALGVANTVVGGAQDRRVLSAIGAVLTGTRSSVESAFFEGDTTDLLVTQMNASRRQVAARLVEGSQASLEDYPLPAAISDLSEYYQAGTMHGALMSSLVTAARDQAEAEARIARLRSTSFTRDESSRQISQWLYPTAAGRSTTGVWVLDNGQPAPVDSARLQQLQAWKNQTPWLVDVPLPTFLAAEMLAEARTQAVVDLNIPTP